MNLWPRLIDYARLMRLHCPIGIALLLWPTLWALWIAAQGHPPLKIVVIFILGVVVMRSAGCVINDIADRNFDGFVARTRDRPIASGKVTVREAWILFAVLGLLAFTLVWQLNRLTIELSVIALVLAMIYPFTKRYTHWPQLILGAAFAWSVPMVFAAQMNTVPGLAWLIYLIALLWPMAYDTMYAMVDREDDQKIGIKSTAIRWGQYDRLGIALVQALVMLLLLGLGWGLGLSSFYYAGLLCALGLVGYQQYLIRHRAPQACFKAFLNNNWFGAAVFLGIVMASIYS